MSAEKHLGKICTAYFGLGGYANAMLGLHLAFTYKSVLGCERTIGAWDSHQVLWNERCNWSEASRDARYAEICHELSRILYEAKVDRVEKLVGIPVELTFRDQVFASFRVLTEVL